MSFGGESGAYFERRCRLKFFLPYGPMKMTAETKNRKKIIHFAKENNNNKMVGRYGVQVPVTKLWCRSTSRFPIKRCLSMDDDGRTDDGQWTPAP